MKHFLIISIWHRLLGTEAQVMTKTKDMQLKRLFQYEIEKKLIVTPDTFFNCDYLARLLGTEAHVMKKMSENKFI